MALRTTGLRPAPMKLGESPLIPGSLSRQNRVSTLSSGPSNLESSLNTEKICHALEQPSVRPPSNVTPPLYCRGSGRHYLATDSKNLSRCVAGGTTGLWRVSDTGALRLPTLWKQTALATQVVCSQPDTSPNRPGILLGEMDLATFRTTLCQKHRACRCPNPDSCDKSHCLTWQRRNPYEMAYKPELCPDIEFRRQNNKMNLTRRCTRGRNCDYAHSKEEELYHPLVYKTKLCTAFPKCRRHFCPFAHSREEIRDPKSQILIRTIWGDRTQKPVDRPEKNAVFVQPQPAVNNGETAKMQNSPPGLAQRSSESIAHFLGVTGLNNNRLPVSGDRMHAAVSGVSEGVAEESEAPSNIENGVDNLSGLNSSEAQELLNLLLEVDHLSCPKQASIEPSRAYYQASAPNEGAEGKEWGSISSANLELSTAATSVQVTETQSVGDTITSPSCAYNPPAPVVPTGLFNQTTDNQQLALDVLRLTLNLAELVAPDTRTQPQQATLYGGSKDALALTYQATEDAVRTLSMSLPKDDLSQPDVRSNVNCCRPSPWNVSQAENTAVGTLSPGNFGVYGQQNIARNYLSSTSSLLQTHRSKGWCSPTVNRSFCASPSGRPDHLRMWPNKMVAADDASQVPYGWKANYGGETVNEVIKLALKLHLNALRESAPHTRESMMY